MDELMVLLQGGTLGRVHSSMIVLFAGVFWDWNLPLGLIGRVASTVGLRVVPKVTRGENPSNNGVHSLIRTPKL